MSKPAEDPYASMEKDQLISMIHFFVKREDERANYLNSFWDQLILYLKDGRYNIDNSLAERSLRTMTVERKRSSLFGLLPTGRKSLLPMTIGIKK